MSRLPLFLFLLLLSVSLWGQSYLAQIDSIIASPRDTGQIWLISDLLSEACNSGEIVNDPIFDRIISIADSQQNSWALALIYFNRGAYELNTGTVEQGFSYTEKAIKYAEQVGQEDLLADAKSLRLELLIGMGNSEAIITEALALATNYRATENLYYESDTYQILSAYSTSVGNHKLATEYDSIAIDLARKSEYIGILITALANAADNQNATGNHHKALTLAQEGVELSVEYELPYLEGNALIARAVSNTALGNYNEALQDYDKLTDWQGDQEFTWLTINKCFLLQRLGRKKEARELLFHTVEVIKNTSNDFSLLKLSYQVLQTMDLEKAQYDSVAKYRKLIATAQDSLQAEKNNKTLLQLRAQYQALQKESKIMLQDQKISSQRRLIYFIAGAFLLVSFVGVLLFILSLKLKNRNSENEQLITDKEALIGEIHHRVKNNLQVISSLLEIQARRLETNNNKGREALKESQSRVAAMGLIHNKLYQDSNVTEVFMPEYLQDLGDTLIDTYRLEEQVDIFYDVDGISLGVENAISLGLIINELVTNSLKYAFPENREGIIEMALHREQDQVRLTIIDNGVGVAAAEKRADSTSYGTSLIQLLTEKLKGSKRILAGSGHGVEIVFPE